MTASAALPSVPLWIAALIALATEAAMLTGLAQWSALRVAVPEPPQIPIEISLTAAPALTETAAVEAVRGISFASNSEPPAAPEPERQKTASIQAVAPPLAPVVQTAIKQKSISKQRLTQKKKPKPNPKPTPKPLPISAPPPVKRPVRPPAPPIAGASTPRPAPQPIESTNHSPVDRAREMNATADSAVTYSNNPKPAYPEAARRWRQEGTVHLRVVVSANGSASAVSVARSSGVASLDQAAVNAVRRWRFKPAQRGGVAVAATVQVPIRFQLN